MSDRQNYSPPQREVDMPTSTAPDSAFEPHSAYMFDEPSTDEELRNMKRNIASINMMGDAGNDAAFDPMHALASGNINHGHQQFQSNFVNPFLFDDPQTGSDSTSWQNLQTLPSNLHAMSTQADILSGRGASVSHQYGQITPPEDSGSKSFAAVNQPLEALHDNPTSNAKSERARNAANQRHAKAKRARKDSGRRADTPDELDDEADGKREKYREKNRLAAAKCRAKKKVNTEDLEQSAREATTRNNQLRAEERHLRDMFSSLRDQALAHDPTQGCGCSAIHSYNMHQAQKAVRGAAMGFQTGTVHSPSQRSIDSGSPSEAAPSRAQSFSSMRPQFAKHGSRSDSVGHQMSFLPSTMADMRHSHYAFASNTSDRMSQSGMTTACNDSNFAEYLQQGPDGHTPEYEA